MHFSLRQLWRLILYHVKNCKWLCQTVLGWADVGMKHGRGNCSWCRESQGEHVDSIALSHWGPKKQLCHNSTHGSVGWSLGEILSLSAPLCILFILLQVQVHVCVCKSQCFGPAPLSKATTANVKSLQFQWGLICHRWKGEEMWAIPCTASCHLDPADPPCWQPPLRLSLGAVSLKTELSGALRAARETGVESACRKGGGRATGKMLFSRGLKRHFTDWKEEAETCLLPLGKSDSRKEYWQQSSGVERGECKTWTAGKGS